MIIITALRKLFQKKQVKQTIHQNGEKYHLQEIFDTINQEYFENRLDLPITWSGSKKRKVRTSRRLGSYNLQSGLIRINRILDSTRFPSYFISYVVYHEMLHHVYPPRRGGDGRRRVHHKKFLEKEREFKDFARAKRWEKENLHTILGTSYGRS